MGVTILNFNKFYRNDNTLYQIRYINITFSCLNVVFYCIFVT